MVAAVERQALDSKSLACTTQETQYGHEGSYPKKLHLKPPSYRISADAQLQCMSPDILKEDSCGCLMTMDILCSL